MSDLLTKEEAMTLFGIKDMRTFNTKDFINIMSSLDMMNPEVAKELIAQIPNFLGFAKESLESIKDMYSETLASDDKSLNQIYASYDLIIETLNDSLKDGELSLDEKVQISGMIRDLIHDKEALHFKQQTKRHDLFKNIAKGVGVAAVAIIAILSGSNINSSSGNIPKHKDPDDGNI